MNGVIKPNLADAKEMLNIWMGRDFDPWSKGEKKQFYDYIKLHGYVDDVLEGGAGTPPKVSQWTFRGGYVPDDLAWTTRMLTATFYKGRYEVEAKLQDWEENIQQDAYVFARLTEPDEILARMFGRSEYETLLDIYEVDWLIIPIFVVPIEDQGPLISAQENLRPDEFEQLINAMAENWQVWEG